MEDEGKSLVLALRKQGFLVRNYLEQGPLNKPMPTVAPVTLRIKFVPRREFYASDEEFHDAVVRAAL